MTAVAYDQLAQRLDLPATDDAELQLMLLRVRRAEILDQLDALEAGRYPDIEKACRDELALVAAALGQDISGASVTAA